MIQIESNLNNIEMLGKREPVSDSIEYPDHIKEPETMEEKPTLIKEKIQRKKKMQDQPEEVKQIIKTYRVIDGVAPVDEYVQDRHRFQVCELFGKIYSKVLSQSNMAANMNKFYILQMLEHKDSKDVYVFFRWGRQGAKGTDCLIPFGKNTGASIAEFEAKFQEKAEEGNYEELEIVFDDELSPEEQEQQMIDSFQACSLPRATAQLIKDLFSLKNIETQIQEIGFDAKKMPLGKLSTSNLKMGFNLLKMISKELENEHPSKDKIESFCSKFFTFIPHDVGFKKMKDFTINTKEAVEKKLEFLTSLSQMKIAKDMIDQENKAETKGNTIETLYQGLKNKIEPLDPNNSEYKEVLAYLESTQGTNSQMKIEVTDIYRITREGEETKFKKSLGNRKLLWHCARLSNYAGILSQGLKVAPPEAPAAGFSFGKGIYFSDMSSQGAKFCKAEFTDHTGLLLLCEVALGNSRTYKAPDYNAGNLPEGIHSTIGQGRSGPLESSQITSVEGYKIPMGPVKSTTAGDSAFPYNKYVVYNADQVKQRYVVRCKFS